MAEDTPDKQSPVIRAFKGRNSTGISGLDLALNGGFIPGSMVLLIGSGTSGIERFAKQFWEISPETRSFFMIDGIIEEGMKDVKGTALQELFAQISTKGFIIDSVSSLILEYGIENVIERIIQSRKRVQAEKDHAILTFYEELHPRYEEILLLRVCDVVIHLREDTHGNEVLRTMHIRKINGMQPPGRVLPFVITDKGIELSTTSRVV